MSDLLQDLRYAVRQLLRNPAFSAIIVLTLALGIGANSMLFSIVHAALLRPLPYPHAERLVSLSVATPERDKKVMDVSGAQLLQDRARSLEALASYDPDGATLTGGGEPRLLTGADVSEDFFRVMGVHPALGREFASEELRRNGPPVVILGHQIWTRDFAGDPRIVGRTVKLDGRSYTVVGVMPPEFSFPRRTEFWLPLPPDPVVEGMIRYRFAVGRLRPDVSIAEARQEASTLLGTHHPEAPRAGEITTPVVMSLHERMYGDLRPALLVLLGTVLCVLLIACANVANLLLARAGARRKEFAVRLALGAGRPRLIRQVMVESLLLALLGGAGGLLFPLYGLKLLVSLGPDSIARVPDIAVNGPVLGFTLAISVASALLFGMTPALALSRTDVHGTLKEGGPQTAGERRQNRSSRLLVIAQLAATVVLLVGAGLLAKSLVRMRSLDFGFRADGVLQARISLPETRYPDSASWESFYRTLLERVRALPGVESAALSSVTPMSGASAPGISFTPQDSTGLPNEQIDLAAFEVGAEYFRTFGIPLRAGRGFSETDRADAPRVAIINEAAVRTFFPDGSAIGEKLPLLGYTVVGVVPAVLQKAAEANPLPTVYTPIEQAGASPVRVIALRTTLDPQSFVPALQRVVRGIDPEQPLSGVTTMNEVLSDSVAPTRFNALLLGTFAALALVLAAFGLYGLIAYTVSQRTREIGVRMALGAQPLDVLELVVRDGLLVVAGGLALGLLGAHTLAHLVTKLLFQVESSDVTVFIAAPLVLAAVALLASYLPARRATRVDPMIALRSE
jgi:putative ABC transport system permease protein